MMMLFNFGIFSFMLILGFYTYVSSKKHLLSMLLSLEFMVLSMFSLLVLYLSLMQYEVYFSMVFLTFSVCEGALGLSILVSLVRVHGNDYFQSFNML
uniref:NADH-ubiquinone oxidoreductase chain 4L n=2 Tax=Eremoneura TaxID=480118 RepID=A0A8A5MAH1_9DIOP|nr:NADH dehydrogenase subunit 4L [Nothybus sumatranus]QQV73787.1 NADH dehydrogenase subunit 4L [Syneches medoganus]QTF87886.1 NADH dehydrogenase subunit 4L [Nothybus sumatranus]